MTQKKNDSINSILQYVRVVDKSFVLYFLLQDFHICSCVPDNAKVATTYLALRNKNNLNIRLRKSNPDKASTNYKRQHPTLRSLRKNENKILSYLPGAFRDKMN